MQDRFFERVVAEVGSAHYVERGPAGEVVEVRGYLILDRGSYTVIPRVDPPVECDTPTIVEAKSE